MNQKVMTYIETVLESLHCPDEDCVKDPNHSFNCIVSDISLALLHLSSNGKIFQNYQKITNF
jgi:hypothetical protein